MKLAIIGSRTFTDYYQLRDCVDKYYYYRDSQHYLDEIVSGGAIGADSLAKQFAEENNFKITTFLPDWEKHGRSAGFIRNRDIINHCDEVLAFWDGKSAGTGHSIGLAKELKKPTLIIYF